MLCVILLMLLFEKNILLKSYLIGLFGIVYLVEYFYLLRSILKKQKDGMNFPMIPCWFYIVPVSKSLLLLRSNTENIVGIAILLLVILERLIYQIRICKFSEKNIVDQDSLYLKKILECNFSYAASDAVASMLICVSLWEADVSDLFVNLYVIAVFAIIYILCLGLWRNIKKMYFNNGKIFHNYSKTAFFIPKTFGIGYTINYRNPLAVILFIIILFAIIWL